MSDAPISSDIESRVGQTSEESSAGDAAVAKRSIIERIMSLNVYEYMLAFSLICILLAIALLFANILGNFSGSALPWLIDSGKI